MEVRIRGGDLHSPALSFFTLGAARASRVGEIVRSARSLKTDAVNRSVFGDMGASGTHLVVALLICAKRDDLAAAAVAGLDRERPAVAALVAATFFVFD